MNAATAMNFSTSFSNSLNGWIKWQSSPSQRTTFFIPRAAASPDNGKGNNKRKTKAKKSSSPTLVTTTTESVSQEQQTPQQQQQVSLSLDDVNPVGLGRKSRQIFDDVWRKFSGLGQISRTTHADEREALDALLIREGPMCEFAIPGAQNTTVIVVGVTSRIGRIIVRKLMLRGYTVKALVRKADQVVLDMLPRSVEIVIGDVGDPSSLQAAVEGKSSKSKLLIAKFKSEDSLNGWEVRQGTYFQDVIASKYVGGMDAKFEFTETEQAVF
ncbi:HCF173 protein [Hibiscus syriacus]|uniref:HCF173 protein n=1 Tax=Hibiscus syriacus TaxID=106335 RepID=A0A6A3A873_HIBSY|nr:HCF173 protein [Hibiscus syriacus]